MERANILFPAAKFIIKQAHLSTSTVETLKKAGTTRLTRNSRIYKTILQSIEDKKGENLVSLDLRKIPEAVADFFIICEANNSTQLKAIADFVEEEVKQKCGERVFKREGMQGMQWIIIDYVNIVVHVMMPDARKFYRLEELWSDGVATTH